MKFNNQKPPYYGTGFLVGSNIIMTCAHNCYHGLYGKAIEMQFYPALNGLVGERCQIEKIHYPKEYEENCDDQLDIAILELKE